MARRAAGSQRRTRRSPTCVSLRAKTRSGSRRRTSTSDREAAARLELRGGARETATCASCVVRLLIVLKTRYTSENASLTRVAEKSPIATGISSPPGFARSWATMSGERSMPRTAHPRRRERQRDAPRTDARARGLHLHRRAQRGSRRSQRLPRISSVAERRVVPPALTWPREVVHCSSPTASACRAASRAAPPTPKIQSPSRDRDEADHDQRPDVAPDDAARRRRGSRRGSRAARRSPARSSTSHCIHSRQHADRVVDAGDDEQHPLRDEAELRALLRRDQRQHGGHHPDPDERDRGDRRAATSAAAKFASGEVRGRRTPRRRRTAAIGADEPVERRRTGPCRSGASAAASGAMNVYSIVPSQRSQATVSVRISKMIPRYAQITAPIKQRRRRAVDVDLAAGGVDRPSR